MTALALQAFLEEKDPILVSRIINSKAFKESREKRNVPKFEEDEYHFNHLSLVPKIWAVEFPEPLKFLRVWCISLLMVSLSRPKLLQRFTCKWRLNDTELFIPERSTNL